MSLAAMLWALTEAEVGEPTDALMLVAMADYADGEGRGCYASQGTLAAHARISRRTAVRVLQRLADAGLIVPGDAQLVAHLRADRRPRVWDLAMPARGARLAPRSDDGVPDRPPRGATGARHGVPPVAHDPSTHPERSGRVLQRETDDGAVGGCAAHPDRRRPACSECQRVVPLHRDRRPPASPDSIAAARAAMTPRSADA